MAGTCHHDVILRTYFKAGSPDCPSVIASGSSEITNCEYTASLILARCRETHAGNHRWHLRFDESLSPDIVLAARLQPGNEEILDYYLLPRLDVLTERLSLRPDNGLIMDVYRFNNLNFFMEMAQRVRMEGTA
jgi:hypothetical protein